MRSIRLPISFSRIAICKVSIWDFSGVWSLRICRRIPTSDAADEDMVRMALCLRLDLRSKVYELRIYKFVGFSFLRAFCLDFGFFLDWQG